MDDQEEEDDDQEDADEEDEHCKQEGRSSGQQDNGGLEGWRHEDDHAHSWSQLDQVDNHQRTVINVLH